MPLFTGMKRRQHTFGFIEGQDHLEHSISKKYKSSSLHSVSCIANGECLRNDWTTHILDVDHLDESCMETKNTITSMPMPLQCTGDSPLPEAHINSTGHNSRQFDSVLNAGSSLELEKAQTSAQSTPTLFNPHFHKHMSMSYPHSNENPLFQQHSEENNMSFSLCPEPLAVPNPRCPECLAGKSGHIHHIGRWKLMDSQ